jgi:hypothetical protein
VNGRDSGSDSGSGATVQAAPARLDNERWILLGGLAAIFAVGVALLFRQPVLVSEASAPAAQPSSGPRANKAKRQVQPNPGPPEPVPSAKAAPAVPLAEKVQQEVDTNLESLKDSLLRMELRRQAGTISDEEYARERGRAEQLLRELVQG